ncbi:MAG: hypothetical protein JNL81_13460 [Hyphomonadaceae bacterium]|nr:hypothetical protein [Hyphomonadaceae bacterium]
MKFTTFLAAGAAATFAMLASAQAQDTTTPPPVAEAPIAVSPSTCGEFPAAPPAPGPEVRQRNLAQHQTAYDTWRTAAEANLACRATEYRTLQAQANTRAAEYEAARTAGANAGTAWQAAIAARGSGGRRN